MLVALVRHGSVLTPLSLAEPYLTPEGRAQMRRSASILRRWDWTAVVSSPLLRARQSAEIVCKELKLPLKVENFLRERAHGPLRGLVPGPGTAGVDFLTKVPGRESVGEFIRRVIAGFERLVKSRNDSSFVVVTHGGVMKVFAAAIMRENIKRIEHASSIIVDLSIRATGGLHAVRASGL